jgi:hypothetical protein
MAERNPNRAVENPDSENQDTENQGRRSFIRVTRFYSDLFEPGTPDISRLNPVARDNGSSASSDPSRESDSPRAEHSRRSRSALLQPVIYSHHINDLSSSFSIPVEDFPHGYHWHTPVEEYPVSRTISRASSTQGNSDLISNSTLSSPQTIDVVSVYSSSSSSEWISSPELEQHYRCLICHHIMTNPAAYSIHMYRVHRR